jgi:dihydropteroate synthase
MTPLYAVPGLPQPGRTLVMGVINVTPDSFSDGGDWFDPAVAVAHGRDLLAEGADIVEVGGESTRPGADRPSVTEELRRVIPVITELAAAGASVSVDTMRAEVAVAAVRAGAGLVNDVSGGQADPEMFAAVAALGVPYVCMHWRGHSVVMQQRAVYDDVVAEVVTELGEQLRQARDAGIAAERLIADPGFGFAKTGEHNWEILRRLDELDALHQPLLAGVSRKTFLGSLLAGAGGEARPAKERDDATTALTTYLAEHGVWGVRVHSVRASVDAIQVVAQLQSPAVHQ